MFFIIYKTINKINNKHYIGMHKTNNLYDGYIGSGKLIRRAIAKYGIENFTKEILYIFDNEQEMKDKEKDLVVISEQTYNLVEGGKGGFGYINRNNLNNSIEQRKKAKTSIVKLNESKTKEQWSEYAIKASAKRKDNGLLWGNLTEQLNTPQSIEKRKETMKIIGHQKGEKNSQYGKPRSEETKRKISETLKKKKNNIT